jgi:hypothetical protein
MMVRGRLTRAQLADWYRLEWLAERELAETVDCTDCPAVAGMTCVNRFSGRPLTGPPAHPARIRRATVPAPRVPA